MAGARKVRAFDLFCGAGGSSCGATAGRGRGDRRRRPWPLATRTFQLNFPKATVYTEDMIRLSPEAVVRNVGNMSLLLASPECTHHSVAKGKHRATRPASSWLFRWSASPGTFDPRMSHGWTTLDAR